MGNAMKSVCCVLEWENAEGLERENVRRFLGDLGQRLAQAASSKDLSVSLLIVFDEDVPVTNIREDIAASPALDSSGIAIRLLNAPATSYYDKKGLAAFFCEDDILIYADSDCEYVPDWFDLLTDPLLTGQASIAAGVTQALPAENLMEEASTFSWFFPHTDQRDRLHSKAKNRFFANNFAVTRKTLLDVPLPRFDASRAHGAEWRKRLAAKGYEIVHCPKAIALHKQYDSFADLMKRAAILGRDKDFGVAQNGGTRGKRLLRAFAAVLELNFKFLKRFFTVGLRNLSPSRWLPVLFIGLAFQWVASTRQLISALATSFAEEKADYRDLIDQASLV